MCKGYAEGEIHTCQLATTSTCPKENLIEIYGGDTGDLDPSANCGEEGSWKGCFIKLAEGIYLCIYTVCHCS